MRIGDQVWDHVTEWTFFEKDTVGKQWVRCTDSIAANISEGYGRFHYLENKKFCYYSRSSLDETLTFLEKAATRNLIPESNALQLKNDLTILRKRLNSYIRSIGPRDQ